MVQIEAIPAEEEELLLAHSDVHIAKVVSTRFNPKKADKELGLHENTRRFSKDTYENKWTKDAAFLSAGGTL